MFVIRFNRTMHVIILPYPFFKPNHREIYYLLSMLFNELNDIPSREKASKYFLLA